MAQERKLRRFGVPVESILTGENEQVFQNVSRQATAGREGGAVGFAHAFVARNLAVRPDANQREGFIFSISNFRSIPS